MEGIVKSIHPQRSAEWFQERLGKFTSSEIYKLLASGRRNMTDEELVLRPKGVTRTTVDEMFGDGAMTYIYDKLNELTTGQVEEDTFRGDAIDWGIAHEPDAIELYEKVKGVKVIDVGFIQYNDFFGGSPDGEVGEEDTLENGLVEVKCPYKGSNHLKMFRIKTVSEFKANHPNHYAQIQGNLLASGRGWCDFISFDPRPKLEVWQIYILRIPREEPFISNIDTRVDKASAILTEEFDGLLKLAEDQEIEIAA